MPKKKIKIEKNVTGATIHGDLKKAVIFFDDGSELEIMDEVVLTPRDKKVIEAELADLEKLKEIAPNLLGHMEVRTHDQSINTYYQTFIAEFNKTDDPEKAALAVLKEME